MVFGDKLTPKIVLYQNLKTAVFLLFCTGCIRICDQYLSGKQCILKQAFCINNTFLQVSNLYRICSVFKKILRTIFVGIFIRNIFEIQFCSISNGFSKIELFFCSKPNSIREVRHIIRKLLEILGEMETIFLIEIQIIFFSQIQQIAHKHEMMYKQNTWSKYSNIKKQLETFSCQYYSHE